MRQISIPTRPRRLRSRWLLTGLWLSIGLGLLMRAIQSSTGVGDYDIDIDTYLHLGDRLLHGRLMYVEGFNAKWPVIQVLYAPAAWLGSIRAHRLLIFAMNVAGGALLARTILLLSHRDLLPLRDGSLVPLGSAVLYVVMSQKMIGGLSGHLHQFANAFLVLGLYLLVRQGSGPLLGAGGCFALAIAVRPNLLLPLAALALAFGVVTRPWRERRRLVDGALVFTGGLLATAMVFLPYLLIPGGAARAWAGAVVLPLEWSAQRPSDDTSLGEIVSRLANTSIAGVEAWVLILPSLLGVLLLLRGTEWLRRDGSRRQLLVPVLCALGLAGLIGSFHSTHFWGHYELMTAPAVVLFSAAGLAALERSAMKPARSLAAAFTTVISLILFLNITVAEASRALRGPKPAGAERVAIERDRRLLTRYLETLPEDQRRFTSPQDFSLHWRFHMPSSTAGVHPSWSLDPYGMRRSWATDLIGLPISEHEACAQLTDRRHQLLIWTHTERGGRHEVAFLRGCLEADTARWEEMTRELGLLSGHHRVFRRRLE